MAKVKGVKTRFDYGNTDDFSTSTTWISLARVVEIKPPPLKASEIKTTVLDNDAGMEDADPGLGDSGESTLKLQFDPALTTTLYSLFRQKKGFRLVYADAPYPSGSKLRFNGWISGIEGEAIQSDNVVEQTITVRVVGLPDFQQAA